MNFDRVHFVALLFGVLASSGGLTLQAQTNPSQNAPIINGLDLSAIPVAAAVQDIDDLYQPDPVNAGRRTVRAETFMYEIDRTAMLFFAPRRMQFYIRYQPRRTDARGASVNDGPSRVYGPIDGDPFLILKLDEQLLQSVKIDREQILVLNQDGQLSQAAATDPLARPKAARTMQAMISSGDAALALRGLTVMNAFLDQGTIPQKAPYIFQVRKLIDLHGARIKQQGLSEPLAATTARLVEQEAKLEEISIELAREQYTAAADVQPVVPANIPAESWGQPVNGIRAAVVPERGSLQLDQTIDLFLILENVSNHDIRMSMFRDLEQSATPRLTSPTGANANPSRTIFSGRAPMVRYWLRPGEKVVVGKPRIVFSTNPAPPQSPAFGTINVRGPIGDYTLGFDIRPQPDIAWDQTGGSTKRIKNEWHGQLTTGEAALRVTAAP